MKKIITLLLMFTCVFLNAQNTVPAIEWAKTIGSGMDEGDGSWDILPLEDGGYMVTGQQWIGDITSEVGQLDYWVAKLDAGGAIVWQQTYGGSQSDQIKRIVKSPDGGYLLAGISQSSDGDVGGHYGQDTYLDWWIIKINDSGDIMWQKNLGGTGNEYLYDAIVTSDGGYILLGTSASNDGDVIGNHNFAGFATDGWIMKVSVAGDIEWQRCYGGFGTTTLTSIQPTPDGGYVIVGETEALGGDVPQTAHGLLDSWMIKTDSAGAIQWSKLFGGSGIDSFVSVKLTESGNYITAGFTDSNDGDISFNHTAPGSWKLRDVWVVELDGDGNIVWEKTYGGIGNEAAYQILPTADCGYALGGFYLYDSFEGQPNRSDPLASTLVPSDGFLMRIGLDGELAWVKTMGGYQNDKIWNFALTPDGGFIMVGDTNSADGDATGNNSIYGYYELWPGYSEWFGTFDNWIIKLGPDCEVPQLTTATSVDTCIGGDVTLTVATTGEKINWYDSTDAITPVFTGAELVLTNITADTSYWVEVSNCRCISPRVNVSVTVNPIPVVTVNDTAVCAGNSATLTAASTGNTINWYSSETATAVLFTGEEYNTPELFATTNYWVEAISPEDCTSQRVIISAVVNAVPLITVEDTMSCLHNTTVITSISEGNTINWYNSATSTEILYTGSEFTTPILSINTNYWVEAVSPQGCVSARTEVAVTVNTLPLLTVADTVINICEGTPAVLSAASAGNTINWYGSETATQPLATGNEFIVSGLSVNTSYWVEAISPEGCASVKTEIMVEVNALPTISAQSAAVCEGSIATLTAFSAGNTINWYIAQNDTAILSSGTEFITPPLQESTSYWIEAISPEGCATARTQVTVTVTALPVITASNTAFSICSGTPALLSATADGSNIIAWFDSETATTPIATGTDYITSVLTEEASYWASAYNQQTQCFSGKVRFTVSVNNNVVPIVTFSYQQSSYCYSSNDPSPVLAAGFTQGGTFSSGEGLAIDATTGSITIRDSQPGSYLVVYQVSNPDICLDYGRFEAHVTIESCDVVQRGISPNVDQFNHYFDLTGMGVMKLSIFNRYGVEVYNASNYVKEWHGQDNKGNELPTGTYFYAITKNNGGQLTGWVYINR